MQRKPVGAEIQGPPWGLVALCHLPEVGVSCMQGPLPAAAHPSLPTSFIPQLPVFAYALPLPHSRTLAVSNSPPHLSTVPLFGGDRKKSKKLNCKEGNGANLRWVRNESISECVRQWRKYLFYKNWANNQAFRNTASRHCTKRGLVSGCRGLWLLAHPWRMKAALSLSWAVPWVSGSKGGSIALGPLCLCIDKKAVTEGKNTLFYLKVVLLKMHDPEAILDSIWRTRKCYFSRIQICYVVLFHFLRNTAIKYFCLMFTFRGWTWKTRF